MKTATLAMTVGIFAAALPAGSAFNGPYWGVQENPTPRALDYEGLIAAKPKAVSGVRQRIVKTAQSYLGAPSKQGGSTPQGFDCTGLVDYVYQ